MGSGAEVGILGDHAVTTDTDGPEVVDTNSIAEGAMGPQSQEPRMDDVGAGACPAGRIECGAEPLEPKSAPSERSGQAGLDKQEVNQRPSKAANIFPM